MYYTKSPNVLAETLPKLQKHWESRAKARTNILLGEAVPFRSFTITMAREAGTMAGVVAHEIGKRLDWPVYDHELLELIAKDMGLHANLLEKVDEKGTNRFHGFARELMSGFASGPIASEDSYVRHLGETLVALAVLGDCVIVGRGASALLPFGSTVRVRLVAPRAHRIAALAKQLGMSAKDAERHMENVDKDRRTFVQRHFQKDPADPANFDLLLNVARFTTGESAELIIAALRHMQARKVDKEPRTE